MIRRLAGLVVVLIGVTLPLTGARADVPQAGITLQSQSAYVTGHGLFSLKIAVSAPDPAHDRLEVLGFPQVITRTDFGSAAKGKVNSFSTYRSTVPVAGFSGQIDIPVDEAAPARSQFGTFRASSPNGAGVFPFQLELLDPDGARIGPPLTTFLVWAGSQQTPLAATVVIPVTSAARIGSTGQVLAPTGAEADRLKLLTGALSADSSVHAGVLSSPLTFSGLLAGAEAGSNTDRQILANLADVPQNGLVEVLPASYSPVDVGALEGAGLGGDLGAQLAAGSQVLNSVYGTSPSPATWVVNGPLDGATLAALAAHHVTQIIVPDGDLTALRSEYTQLTFAHPTGLEYGNTHLSVMAADPGLTADFTANEPPVLAANHLLADLAMIQTEQPANTRGVAALPPPGWRASADFVKALLAGLAGNPLVTAANPSSIFSSVPPASPGLTRQLANPTAQSGDEAPILAAQAPNIQTARAQINAMSTVLAAQSSVSTSQLRLELLLAESTAVSDAQRKSILDSIGAEARRMMHQISLPAAGSVTLTANRGQLPITVLSAPSLRARVELRLTSQRLIFQPFNPPGGTCRIPTPTTEICTLSLTSQNTTLKVPVQTRSSGVFPLDVKLYSPGGALELAHDRDTVRSTAVSGVGVVLIVVALVSLLVWWGRDLRHGRRPRRLAPPPATDPEENDIILSDDPVVHEFFAGPAPEYKPPRAEDERRIG